MRKIIATLAAVVLLSSAALAGAEEKIKAEQPKIFDLEITIHFDDRTMEISFGYEKVAGHIDDAKKMIVFGVVPASGEIMFSITPLTVTDSRGKGEDGITSSVITQGRVRYYGTMPNTLEISDAEEVASVGISVVDGLGRKGEMVLTNDLLKKKKETKKFEI